MSERIGFVGIGEMGSRMAPRLGSAGHSVVAFDVNREAVDAFVRTNKGRAAESLADVALNSDIVITMLPNGAVVREVFLQMEDGILGKALRSGSVVVDMSSSDPLGTRRLSGILAQRDVAMVDAPVSGGITGAEQGKLVLMIGTDAPAALERVRPVLSLLAHKMFVVGGAGAGHAMKALNNFVSGTGFLAGLEALVIGRKFGLDPSVMVDVLNESTGRNFATTTTLKQEVISRQFATKFQLGLLAKDINIAAGLADDLQVNAPLTRESRDLMASAREAVGAAADHTEAVKYWEKLNGLIVSTDRKS